MFRQFLLYIGKILVFRPISRYAMFVLGTPVVVGAGLMPTIQRQKNYRRGPHGFGKMHTSSG